MNEENNITTANNPNILNNITLQQQIRNREQEGKKTMPICFCTILPVPCNLNCANYAKAKKNRINTKEMKTNEKKWEKNHTNLNEEQKMLLR